MKTLTKTLLMATTLTLGCDGADLDGADFGGDDVALRPGGGFGGIQLNGPVFNVEEVPAVFDTKKGFHQRAILTKVCLQGQKSDDICLDEYWVEKGQLWGRKGSMPLFSGADFVKSAWYVKYDLDGNGVVDSSYILRINHMDERPMPAGTHFIYDFVYNTWEVGGDLSKKIEQSKDPVYLCNQDPDTGSYGMTALGDVDVDYKSAELHDRPNTITLGCLDGGLGKAPTWNYFHHDVGTEFYETIVRVIRADYCADNTSWTLPGTSVAIRDKLGVADSTDPSYKLEALWEVGGSALCVYAPRHADPAVIAGHCGIQVCGVSDEEGDWGAHIMTQNP